LLIFGLSMMLRHLWLEVRWLLGDPQRGRGGRQIAKGLLPFQVCAMACLGGLEGSTLQDLAVPSNGVAESMVGDSVNY
jgi:hypothetical protein